MLQNRSPPKSHSPLGEWLLLVNLMYAYKFSRQVHCSILYIRKKRGYMFRKVKVDYINSKLIGQRIPLLAIVPDNVFWLKSIKEKKEFNNGKYSDVVTGYIYECIEPVNLEIYSIKVEGQKVPLMTNEQLQNLRNSGQRVIIEAVNASIMSYVTNRNGIEDSCKADDVKLIETEE